MSISITPKTLASNLAKIRKSSGVSAVFEPGKYPLASPIEIQGSNASVSAASGRPKTVANGKVVTHFSIGKSARNAAVRDLEFDSDDPAGQWPYGFQIGGNGVEVSNVKMNHVHYAFDLLDAAKNVVILDCHNSISGSVWNYFCYAKGRNITLRNCLAGRPLSGFLRTNQCVGLNIFDCESFGGESDGAASFRIGRVLLQSVADVTIYNLKIHRSFLGTGPLFDINGWNQRKSDADFFSRRTAHVKADAVLIDGGGWIEIGYGSEDVRINTVGPTPPIKFPVLKTSLPSNVAAKLPPPKDIWINGKKLR